MAADFSNLVSNGPFVRANGLACIGSFVLLRHMCARRLFSYGASCSGLSALPLEHISFRCLLGTVDVA